VSLAGQEVPVQVDDRVVLAALVAEAGLGAGAPAASPQVAFHYGFTEAGGSDGPGRFHAPAPVPCLRRGLRAWRARWRRYAVDTWLAAATADAFWARCRRRYPVAAVRDGAWLAARFRSRQGVRYHVLVARRWGRVGAWAVLRLADGSAHLLDLAWDGDDPRALHALDDEARRAAEAFGAPRMEMWLQGDEAARRVLLEYGWEEHSEPSPVRLGTVVFDLGIDGPGLARRFYATLGDVETDGFLSGLPDAV
jgi:hypothetical protein